MFVMMQWSITKNNYLIYPYLLDFEVTLLEKVTLLTSFHHSFLAIVHYSLKYLIVAFEVV